MFRRKIESVIMRNFETDGAPVLIIDGARQVGKSYIIRAIGSREYKNFVEINLLEDKFGQRLFQKVSTTRDLYFAVQAFAGRPLGDYSDTLVFLDEIQEYGDLFTLLKFLREEHRYKFVVSGSLLGVELKKTSSVPVGSTETRRMYPMDFEEFAWACGVQDDMIREVRNCLDNTSPVPDAIHKRLLGLFKDYLIAGGLPYCVDLFLTKEDVVRVRDVQLEIFSMYGNDAAKYDSSNKAHTKAIFDLIPSNIENKRKRVFAKDILGDNNARLSSFKDDFDDIVSSGVVLQTVCCSNPVFPLRESAKRNLLKLYLADVGLLTAILYRYNVKPLLGDEAYVNLGAVYECVAAMQIAANGHELYYSDNKKLGELDFLLDDYDSLSVQAVEIKSGKDHRTHKAMNNYLETSSGVSKGYVFSNDGCVRSDGKLTYLPIYALMFL